MASRTALAGPLMMLHIDGLGRGLAGWFGISHVQFELTPFSYIGLGALYDPEAVSQRAPEGDAEDWLQGEARRGTLLAYAGSFCEPMRLLVDEEPERDLRERAAHGVRGALLRVPSGSLYLADVESIQPPSENDADEPPTDAYPSCVRIPAGNYRAEAFDVTWDHDQLQAEAETLAEPGDLEFTRRLDRLALRLPAFLIFTFVFTAIAGFMDRKWAVLGIPICLGLIAVWWWIGWLRANSPRVRRTREAWADIDRRYPMVVISLRRLADDADIAAMQGGCFGKYFTARAAQSG